MKRIFDWFRSKKVHVEIELPEGKDVSSVTFTDYNTILIKLKDVC